MTKDQLLDQAAIQFSALCENLEDLREAIAGELLNEASRHAKRLAYSAQSFVALLEILVAINK
jgi:hypothetical protein